METSTLGSSRRSSTVRSAISGEPGTAYTMGTGACWRATVTSSSTMAR